MDRNRDCGEGWTVREWRALTLLHTGRMQGPRLDAQPGDTPMANLISSLGGGASACRAARSPSQGNQTKARWLWEAPLTAQRASAEAPFPQPNDAVCPVPVHGPRATSPGRQGRARQSQRDRGPRPPREPRMGIDRERQVLQVNTTDTGVSAANGTHLDAQRSKHKCTTTLWKTGR